MTPQQLNAWREAMGLNATEAAAKLGVSRQTWYTWARGDTPVPAAVEMACKYLTMMRDKPHTKLSKTALEALQNPVPLPTPQPTDDFVFAAPFAGPPGLS